MPYTNTVLISLAIQTQALLLGISDPKACKVLSLSGHATYLNCVDLYFDPC